jgi:carbon-monoxide dehydrogenase medium subunit
VKAARFEYRAAGTVEEALELLAAAPDETSLLAGGQSLVPMLNMRLARPRLVVDLNRVSGLSGIERRNGTLRIGAMTRQRALEVDPLAGHVPLLAAATRHIAHVPIRTRGTIGGSLAHADPAAELPATVAALEGRLLLRSRRGVRSIAAEEFFIGPLTSARKPDEILETIEIPVPGVRTGWAFREVARAHGAFALVGAATTVQLREDGRLGRVRLALLGVGGSPYLPEWLEQMTAGEEASESLFAEIADRVRESVRPSDDQHTNSTYRRDVAATLTVRTLGQATTRALDGSSPARAER